MAELDNVESGIFIIAATNRPDLLDPSILTSGKFDKRIFLGIMNSINSRVNIIKSIFKDFELS